MTKKKFGTRWVGEIKEGKRYGANASGIRGSKHYPGMTMTTASLLKASHPDSTCKQRPVLMESGFRYGMARFMVN